MQPGTQELRADVRANRSPRMKVEFLTQNDPLYILPFFEEFLRHYVDEFDIVGISCCRTMGKRSRKQLIRELVALYGPIGFTRLAIRNATMRVLGKMKKHRDAVRFHSIHQLADAYGLYYEAIGDPNLDSFKEGLQQRNADLVVSVACPYILKAKLLRLPPMGCINIHHAPLPRYKGMMPTFWQLYHGETSVGVTVHYMEPKVDEGAVLLQESLPVEPGEVMDHLIRRAKRHGAHCVAKVLRQLSTGTQQIVDLNGAKPSYFTFPTPAEAKEFRRRGHRAI